MKLILDKNEIKGRALNPLDATAATEKALKKALIGGKVGALSVDPQYLVIKAPRSKYYDIKVTFKDQTRVT